MGGPTNPSSGVNVGQQCWCQVRWMCAPPTSSCTVIGAQGTAGDKLHLSNPIPRGLFLCDVSGRGVWMDRITVTPSPLLIKLSFNYCSCWLTGN